MDDMREREAWIQKIDAIVGELTALRQEIVGAAPHAAPADKSCPGEASVEAFFESLPPDNLDDFVPAHSPSPEHTPTGTIESPSRSVADELSVLDYFRFKRALFADSDIEMRECLDALSMLQTPEQMEQYLFDHLRWDRRNTDVRDFVEVVRHFYC